MLDYEALWLLVWAVPLLGLAYVYGFWRKRAALKLFADGALLARVNGRVSLVRQVVKAVLLLAAAVALVMALFRPAWLWNPHSKTMVRKGRDLVVLLDVSRSMLARDNQANRPSRLARAQLAVEDLLDELEGDRVALVAFAGGRKLVCPLTHDYGFARLALREVDTESVRKGGSLVGDALRMATKEIFEEAGDNYRDIVLFTDGEDHDSYVLEAAAEAGEKGIRIFAFGLGDKERGSRIQVSDVDGRKVFLQYGDEQVWSKLNYGLLAAAAQATPGGRYFEVGTGAVDLPDIYRNHINAGEQKELDSAAVVVYDEAFQILLGLALVLLMVEAMISERKKS